MKESGLKTQRSGMEEAFRYGLMGLATKGTGETTEQMEKAGLFTQMEISTKENGLMIKLTVLESINTLTAPYMKGIGRKINNMDMAEKFGLTVPLLKVTTWMVRNKEREHLPGRMAVHTLETFKRIIYTERVSINGLMVDCIKVLGSTIRCTDMEYLHGLMDDAMKETTVKIRSKVEEHFSGAMVENMWVVGTMESSMVQVFMCQ